MWFRAKARLEGYRSSRRVFWVGNIAGLVALGLAFQRLGTVAPVLYSALFPVAGIVLLLLIRTRSKPVCHSLSVTVSSDGSSWRCIDPGNDDLWSLWRCRRLPRSRVTSRRRNRGRGIGRNIPVYRIAGK